MYFVVKSVSDIVFKYNCLLKTGKNKRRSYKSCVFLCYAPLSWHNDVTIKCRSPKPL